MMQGVETERKTPSCLVNGHRCCVSDSILVSDSIWVPEIVNSGLGTWRPSSTSRHLPQYSWV